MGKTGPAVALITGVTGQDGSYLAEFLLSEGWIVYGGVRRSSVETEAFRYSRICHLALDERMHHIALDVTCFESVLSTIATVSPDHIYHLAANSFVADSFNTEHDVLRVNEVGTLNVLRAAKECCPTARIYFAGTSEMYGNHQDPKPLLDEKSEMRPVSPYGISKLGAYHLCRYYRDRYGMFISCGILFNHESPRRGEQFVTRKITLGVGSILANKRKEPIVLGNLQARRDWGYAPEYVEGMHRMLLYGEPDDFVLATGTAHSVETFVREAFRAGIEIAGMSPDQLDGLVHDYVQVSDKFKRPNELHYLRGNAAKAHVELQWTPKVGVRELVRKMVERDYYAQLTGKYHIDVPTFERGW